MNVKEHNANIVDQFTKQAIPFTQLPGHLDSIQMLIEMSDLTPEDNVLDVACGPGLVLCEFAKIANRATGIDITNTMLEQAQKRQSELNLTNITWDLGDVTELPYPSESFSVVITRYSFHHFVEPDKVLAEMFRVCKPNGTILIADVVLPIENLENYNKMERLRDNSHTSGLTFDQMEKMLHNIGLKKLKRGSYKVEMELEKQLKASFPKEGDDEIIREIFRQDITTNKLGMDVHLVGEEIHFSYPISIYSGKK